MGHLKMTLISAVKGYKAKKDQKYYVNMAQDQESRDEDEQETWKQRRRKTYTGDTTIIIITKWLILIMTHRITLII